MLHPLVNAPLLLVLQLRLRTIDLEQKDTVSQVCVSDFKLAFDVTDRSVEVTYLRHLG